MWIQRFLDNSWLSCHKYAQRQSQTYEQELPLRERAGLIFHYYFCPVCRRFAANLEKMQQALKALSQKMDSGEIESEETLPPEVKGKIIERLKQI